MPNDPSLGIYFPKPWIFPDLAFIEKKFEGNKPMWRLEEDAISKELEKVYKLNRDSELEKKNRELERRIKELEAQLKETSNIKPTSPEPQEPQPNQSVTPQVEVEEEIEKDLEDIEDIKSSYNPNIALKEIIKECDRLGIKREVGERFFEPF